jgi:phosphatidylserine/phosphatidylglycerophosphate/cardiolipin synthase-like enzyme
MSFRLVETGWDDEFAAAAAATSHEIRIVAPFLQLDAAQKLVTKKLRALVVVTRFNLDDFCAGVSSLDALDWLLKQGAQIRGIQNLHAKAYIFDKTRAIVTSGNLTTAALVRNHELGFITTGTALVAECRAYFDRMWSKGRQLDIALLGQIRSRIEEARRVERLECQWMTRNAAKIDMLGTFSRVRQNKCRPPSA